MLDIKMIREKPSEVRKNLERRHDPSILARLDEAIKADAERRDVIKQVETLKKKRNEITKEVSSLKAKGNDAKKELKDAGEVAAKISKLDIEQAKLDEKTKLLLMVIPNLLHESVPEGKDDTDNAVVKTAGGTLGFTFKPKNHLEIALALGLIDEERASKVSGTGFFYLKEELAILDMAIVRYTIDFLRKRGLKLIEPPFMMRKKAYEGVVSLEDFENVMYKIEDEDLYMIATSEHPIGAMLGDEIVLEKDLPMKFVGVSPCFRKEIGAHGKYTKGIFRVHQFNKVEQFVFSRPEDSWKLHEELQKNSEELLGSLGIKFRVVNVCTGDIGSIAAKKYDIEFLMADGNYREIGSNSNCTDYQARRLGIRYKEKEGMAVKGFVHTLNNTAAATSRVMVAILEQFQQADGSVAIPAVLQPYCGFAEMKRK